MEVEHPFPHNNVTNIVGINTQIIRFVTGFIFLKSYKLFAYNWTFRHYEQGLVELESKSGSDSKLSRSTLQRSRALINLGTRC